MLKKYKAFSLLFLIIFLLQLGAEIYALSWLSLVVKPIIVLSLLVFFYWRTRLKGRFHKRLFTGLLFAWIGDILLMLPALSSHFIYGLLAFLLCHIFYIRAFYLDFRSAQELDKRGARIAIVLCTIFGMGFYVFLRPYLDSMKLPVMTYTFVICMMLMMSVFRNQRVNKESFNLIFTGALFFVLSDSLLAYHKFVGAFDLAGTLIMGTYMVAQYLIVIGGVERKLILS